MGSHEAETEKTNLGQPSCCSQVNTLVCERQTHTHTHTHGIPLVLGPRIRIQDSYVFVVFGAAGLWVPEPCFCSGFAARPRWPSAVDTGVFFVGAGLDYCSHNGGNLKGPFEDSRLLSQGSFSSGNQHIYAHFILARRLTYTQQSMINAWLTLTSE